MQTVPCNGTHTAEVVGTQGCSEDALRSYLGAIPDVDVLSSAATSEEWAMGDTAYCVARLGDTEVVGSAFEAFSTDVGHQWRRCRDERVNKEVSCTVPHTAEFVYNGVVAGGTGLDCSARAKVYLNIPFEQVALDLSLRSITDSSGTSQCIIDVRGNNVLTTSLRRVGVSLLPITDA